MTIKIIFFIGGFNILLSQQDCYNLDFANKSWLKQDSIVSVMSDNYHFEIKINDKIIDKIRLEGNVIDFKLYDILGKTIPFSYDKEQNKLNIVINDHLLKGKLIILTFSTISKNGFKYHTFKNFLE